MLAHAVLTNLVSGSDCGFKSHQKSLKPAISIMQLYSETRISGRENLQGVRIVQKGGPDLSLPLPDFYSQVAPQFLGAVIERSQFTLQRTTIPRECRKPVVTG